MTAPQTNEEIKNKLYKVFLDFMESHEEFLESKELPRTFSISYWEDKIMSIISDYKGEIVKYEQLECEILQPDWMDGFYDIQITMPVFNSKKEALDFCKRFNLKVVNEEKE